MSGFSYAADHPVEGFDARVVSFLTCTVAFPRPRRGIVDSMEPTRLVSMRLWPRASAELTLDAFLAIAREPVDARSIVVGGQRVERAWLAYVEASIRPDGRLGLAFIDVAAELPELIPFPFTPGRVAPARDGDLPFATAFRRVCKMSDDACHAADIVETADYWLFPVRGFAGPGTIVGRRGDRTCVMQSGIPRAVWEWAWDHDLVDKTKGFVVDACSDAEELASRLRRIYHWLDTDFTQLPLHLPWNASALQDFHELRDQLVVCAAKVDVE